MHIAFLNPQGNFDFKDSYWTEHPDFGGQLVYVKEVAIAIAALGHQVDILTRRVIDSEWPEFEAPLDRALFFPKKSCGRTWARNGCQISWPFTRAREKCRMRSPPITPTAAYQVRF